MILRFLRSSESELFSDDLHSTLLKIRSCDCMRYQNIPEMHYQVMEIRLVLETIRGYRFIAINGVHITCYSVNTGTSEIFFIESEIT
jgi:hypothetical protein